MPIAINVFSFDGELEFVNLLTFDEAGVVLNKRGPALAVNPWQMTNASFGTRMKCTYGLV